MKKNALLLFGALSSMGCNSTPFQQAEGVRRGPISELILGKASNQETQTSYAVSADISDKKYNHQNVYNEGYSWGYFFTAYMKMSKYFSYEQNATDLMRIAYPETYKRYKNDEFELKNKKKESIEKIKQTVANFDEQRIHQMFVEWDFGAYDFAKSEFPLDSITATSSYRFKQDLRIASNKLPKEFRLYFTNSEIIGNLKMPAETAKVFLQKKKNTSGQINRKLPAMFYFKLVRLDEGEGIFYAEILDGEVYYGKNDNRVVKWF